jgi:hypothetical protein
MSNEVRADCLMGLKLGSREEHDQYHITYVVLNVYVGLVRLHDYNALKPFRHPSGKFAIRPNCLQYKEGKRRHGLNKNICMSNLK